MNINLSYMFSLSAVHVRCAFLMWRLLSASDVFALGVGLVCVDDDDGCRQTYNTVILSFIFGHSS